MAAANASLGDLRTWTHHVYRKRNKNRNRYLQSLGHNFFPATSRFKACKDQNMEALNSVCSRIEKWIALVPFYNCSEAHRTGEEKKKAQKHLMNWVLFRSVEYHCLRYGLRSTLLYEHPVVNSERIIQADVEDPRSDLHCLQKFAVRSVLSSFDKKRINTW